MAGIELTVFAVPLMSHFASERRRKCSSSSRRRNVEYTVRHPGGMCARRPAAPLVDARHTTAWIAMQRPLRDTWRRQPGWLT